MREKKRQEKAFQTAYTRVSPEREARTVKNYIERVQLAVDWMEGKLTTGFPLEKIPAITGMSLSTFYRVFFNLVGLGVKEYLRCRRVDLASRLLQETPMQVVEVAFECGFESHEVFCRNFRKRTGFSPQEFRKGKKFFYGKVNLMEKYFEVQDATLLKKYPDIRIVKQLGPFRVAYYRAMGKNPEMEANRVMLEWAKKRGLLKENSTTRIFGFNNPNPQPGKEEYGYEVWVTLKDNVESGDERISFKEFAGGRYALLTTTVAEVGNAWKRFSQWLQDSKYEPGTHQWLEEMISFNENENDIALTLYMPLGEKAKE
ncbi:MAG TPA: AraC family transcriptional regulator [Thermotogota bacterium]|nr:AraC family transcriptional regulator [Thermotogota bacterium]